jgi:Protein of unknown function (DUF2867)
MKLPNAEHTDRPWRIHEFTGDFRLLDVWALGTPGGHDDFPRLVQVVASFDPTKSSSRAVRTLFAIRELLGTVLGWDDGDDRHHPPRPTLRDRLPADLRHNPACPSPPPFAALYQTDDEWAAEIFNRTVHGVLHLGWVPDQTGGYRGQLAILVKPNGLLGVAYLAAIAPFRYLIVYPHMLGELKQRWREGARGPGVKPPTTPG